MDDFEKTLSQTMDRFIALQQWADKQRSGASPKLKEVFELILSIADQLKGFQRSNKSHPLYDLAREVMAAFQTKEFNAILLEAYRWRKAKKRSSEPAQTPATPHLPKLVFPRKRIHTPKQPKELATQRARQLEEDRRSFLKNLNLFLESVSPEVMRSIRNPEEGKDFYRSGRRLPGSYGSAQ